MLLKRMTSAAALITAWLLGAVPGSAHTAVSVQVTVTPKTSQTDVAPQPPSGNSASDNRFYIYNVTEGSAVNDTIDVDVCITSLTENDPTLSWNFSVEIGPDGPAGNLPGVTSAPAVVSFSKGDGLNTCRTLTIVVASGALSDIDATGVDYSKNLLVHTVNNPGSNDHLAVTVAGSNHLKLQVFVSPAPSLSCFATDSSFQFLFACDGTTPVTSGSDGRFVIVANKKNIEVATNPGQFYYHVLWTNTGSAAKTVAVNFNRYNVRPQGAQAIHAGLFPPPFSGVDLNGFNTVNDSIPSGSDDKLENISVPAGWTLWVTYHLEWQGLGLSIPIGAVNSCSTANQNWFVTATISGGASGQCVAGGKGYLKK